MQPRGSPWPSRWFEAYLSGVPADFKQGRASCPSRMTNPGAVFRAYDTAIWPAHAHLLGILAVALVPRPQAASGRILLAILALMWFWTGIACHGLFFATINRAAIVFAVVFVVQGLMPVPQSSTGLLI